MFRNGPWHANKGERLQSYVNLRMASGAFVGTWARVRVDSTETAKMEASGSRQSDDVCATYCMNIFTGREEPFHGARLHDIFRSPETAGCPARSWAHARSCSYKANTRRKHMNDSPHHETPRRGIDQRKWSRWRMCTFRSPPCAHSSAAPRTEAGTLLPCYYLPLPIRCTVQYCSTIGTGRVIFLIVITTKIVITLITRVRIISIQM